MPSSDEDLIARIHQETCQYLDRLEAALPIWDDIDMQGSAHETDNIVR